MVSVDQLHNLQRITQKKAGSIIAAMTQWSRCVIITNMQNQ